MRMLKVFALAAIVSLTTACAATGLEARLGMYREDTRQQSSKTYDKPLKCLFVSCEQEARGS